MKIVSSVLAVDSSLHLAAFSNTAEASESTCFPVLSLSGCRVGIFTAEGLCPRWERVSAPSCPWTAQFPHHSPTSLALLSHRSCRVLCAIGGSSPLVLWPLCPHPTAEAGTGTWLLAVPGMSRMEGRLFLQTLRSIWMQGASASLGAHCLASPELRVMLASFFSFFQECTNTSLQW